MSLTPTAVPTVPAVQRRTVSVLFGSQMLGGVGVAMGLAVGTLLAEDLTGSAGLAGLAQTFAVAGAAVMVAPISRTMAARGRRPGILLGYVLAAGGSVLAVAAASAASYPLLLLGLFLFGSGTATNMQARYAATDLAPRDRRGRALSTVVWATTVGAVAGPNLIDPAGRAAQVLGIPTLAGPFVWSALAFATGAVIVFLLLRPDPLLVSRADASGGVLARRTSLREAVATIGGSPGATLGLLAIAVAHTVMIAVMIMTPVHMDHGGTTLQVIGLVISGHLAGMYALSPVVGWFADRYGRVAVIVTGQGVLLAAFVLAGTAGSHDSARLGVGLFLLGLGWSCGLVSGSALLTESVPTEARPAVQGAADLLTGVGGVVGGSVGGLVVNQVGFGVLNAGAAVLVVPVLTLALRRRRYA